MKTNCGSSPDSISFPVDPYIEKLSKKSGFFDLPKEKKCNHTDHEPPKHLYIPQGKGYRHVCPGCGAETVIIPPQISF